jgi:hypothetical protein
MLTGVDTAAPLRRKVVSNAVRETANDANAASGWPTTSLTPAPEVGHSLRYAPPDRRTTRRLLEPATGTRSTSHSRPTINADETSVSAAEEHS